MTRTIVDISILQTVPPSNINRDDTGSPKTANYGGTRRARVSSQAWKRATRLLFDDVLDKSDLGVRTKRVVELLGDRIRELQPEIDTARAQELAELAFAAARVKLTEPRGSTKDEPLPKESGYLLFLSSRQLDQVASLCVEADASDDPKAHLKAGDVKKAFDTAHSVDLALFGRMVAEATDLNVDAACQVAHAISVHAVDNEFDYFTAVDDHKAADDEEDAGAGMIGTVEFNASTLYRYATIDVDALQRNLGDAEGTRRAVEAFVKSFVTSMPTGKQNTFANRTLPDGVVISVRSTQPVNLVGAYEEAIVDPQRLKLASTRLAAHAKQIDAAFGTTPDATWVVRVGDATEELDALGPRASLSDAIEQLGATVSERL
ncbi:type I-E CRISPR-associated protein Cas7/Cse4/CasC [Microbacterium sp. ARD32]|uniref:type I-E CRISPR-associated protein Cas7/Cse4/CasC n=1 Tax=Microbacterium sp. ARD32 TaxID=2962577 RepID=UPI0028822235|nr:type I-E CRISPR-associated protein Cas7/Cse4/CasC [Microbacterium sp. ARD32]MDT0157645.1 type I-E CRISPR-associated protein Cas7/Cse4/CasC [Microbacterium sp. ARD32]